MLIRHLPSTVEATIDTPLMVFKEPENTEMKKIHSTTRKQAGMRIKSDKNFHNEKQDVLRY
jgi:hypothetical protein